jgi:type IV pilus assembly protein PilN
MVRINLLPIKQDRRRERGRTELLVGFGVLAIVGAICFVVHLNVTERVEEQKNKNDAIRADVERIKKQIKDHDAILAETQEFEKRQAAINGLQDARTGPVYVMLELANLLSRGGRPHIDNAKYQELIQVDPAAGYDESWDYRRVWLDSFKEASRDVVISGQALSHEDVAEFLRRLNLSEFFVSNKLISTSVKSLSLRDFNITDKSIDDVVFFELSGRLRYR